MTRSWSSLCLFLSLHILSLFFYHAHLPLLSRTLSTLIPIPIPIVVLILHLLLLLLCHYLLEHLVLLTQIVLLLLLLVTVCWLLVIILKLLLFEHHAWWILHWIAFERGLEVIVAIIVNEMVLLINRESFRVSSRWRGLGVQGERLLFGRERGGRLLLLVMEAWSVWRGSRRIGDCMSLLILGEIVRTSVFWYISSLLGTLD